MSLVMCAVIDDASGVSRLAGFVAHHTALGAGAFHFYDIASVPLTEAAWAALRHAGRQGDHHAAA